MAIWSLTTERLEKLKAQIAAKKAQYDELDALTEKDLWIKDLDEFAAEWDAQLRLDAEITTGIRRMGRRASQKIGAGTGKGRRLKDDDDYQPEKKSRPKAPKVEKVETKTQQRFAEKFQAAVKPKPKAEELSDDDFALLGKKTAVKQESEPPASVEEAASGRNKRAAATKSKYVLSDDSDEDFMDLGKPDVKEEEPDLASEDEEEVVPKPTKRAAASKAKPRYVDEDGSESEEEEDDDNMLGDVGALVKGIGGPSSSSGGRLSLFAMSRPEAGDAPLPKMKTKPSKSSLDFDSHDDTNYEALAMSSPRKSTTATKADDLDDFLSDDDLPAAGGSKPAGKPTKGKAPLSVVPAAVKKRGRPAGSKNKPKDAAAAPKTAAAVSKASKPKTSTLSPAAKAYAAKKAKAGSRRALSDDEDDLADGPASPVAAKSKARPGRAAAAKAKPIYIDDEDDSMLSAGGGRGKDDSDAFDMDEDSE